MGLAGYRFGDDIAPIQPAWHGLAYGLLIFLLVYAGLNGVRVWKNRSRLSIRPGEYLLPMSVVRIADNTDGEFTVEPLDRITNVQLTHHFTNNSYQRTSIVFHREQATPVTLYLRGQQRAEKGRHLWALRRDRLQRMAKESLNEVTLKWFFFEDPFALMSDNAWLELSKPVPPPTDGPAIAPFGRVLSRPAWHALLAGVALTLVAWGMRNIWSDAEAWRYAHDINTAPAVQRYLDHGWLHRAEALAQLPHAALADAVREGTVAAFRSVVATYGSQSPDVAADANTRIHRLFDDSRAKLRQHLAMALPPCPNDQDPKDDPTAEDDAHLFTTLLAIIDSLEQHPGVRPVLGFVRPAGDELARVDTILTIAAKTDNPGVTMSPMAPAFDARATSIREQQLADALIYALRTILPQGVLELDRRDHIPDDRPALVVSYVITPSGSIYIDAKTKTRGFGGIMLEFTVEFRIPGTAPAHFAAQVQPPSTFSVTTFAHLGASDATVYDTMARRAFDRFTGVICRRFHQPPPPPQSEQFRLDDWRRLGL